MADVIVIGGGPAGLTCSTHLARAGAEVVLLDRDVAPGGVPRYTDHLGYGIRDLRLQSGPRYAHRLSEAALAAGVQIRTSTTATGLTQRTADGTRGVEVTAPSGREVLQGRAIVLATGCRERPRSARLIPGSRPSGIYSTAWLQRATLAGSFTGRRAVIVGAEHVSYSAVMTLHHAGCRTVAMVTDLGRHQTYAPVDLAARLRYRFPVLNDTRIRAVEGSPTLESVVVDGPGGEQRLACDTLIVSGDWVAENELARRIGLAVSTPRGAVPVNSFQTAEPGIFAAGNILHPAKTADACARDGEQAARVIGPWLAAQRT
ncbi:MAG TPA: hypothetical protein DCQ36_01985 [Actinobacteria bacterium]|jgi:thioredoxin reductase|nr:hypothetical protein [Actinomycetota bacterium]